MTDLTYAERAALDVLPLHLADFAIKAAAHNRVRIHEIRLRRGAGLSITSRGISYACPIRCTEEDIDAVLRRLCGNSLYSHADTIREGYIAYLSGIRAGVCGRAVCRGGEIDAVTDITSVNIRIPHRVRGAGDCAFELLERNAFRTGLLVYSPPGVGKTTLLRELTFRLGAGDAPRRVAVVDTRCEIMAGLEGAANVDVLSSYPRGRGIEIAVRTLSPEFIVCDEISSDSDVEAVMSAVGSGVCIIASAHGASYGELMQRDGFCLLREKRAFGIWLGLLERERAGYRTEVSFIDSVPERAEETGV